MTEQKGIKRHSIIVLAAVVLLVFFHFIGALKPVENLAIRIFSPVQNILFSTGNGIKGFYQDRLQRRNLVSENEILKDQIQKLTIENSQLKIFRDENDSLRKLMGFYEDNKLPHTTARIIAKDTANPNIYILNRGTRDNIKNGDPVVADEGFIIGKIISTDQDNSKCMLLTDNQSLIAATIQNGANTVGAVEGEYGLSIIMKYIPQNEEVKEGDIVITSGLENNIPKGLIIGHIEKVQTSQDQLFKEAYLAPLVNLEKISLVSVINQ